MEGTTKNKELFMQSIDNIPNKEQILVYSNMYDCLLEDLKELLTLTHKQI